MPDDEEMMAMVSRPMERNETTNDKGGTIPSDYSAQGKPRWNVRKMADGKGKPKVRFVEPAKVGSSIRMSEHTERLSPHEIVETFPSTCTKPKAIISPSSEKRSKTRQNYAGHAVRRDKDFELWKAINKASWLQEHVKLEKTEMEYLDMMNKPKDEATDESVEQLKKIDMLIYR